MWYSDAAPLSRSLWPTASTSSALGFSGSGSGVAGGVAAGGVGGGAGVAGGGVGVGGRGRGGRGGRGGGRALDRRRIEVEHRRAPRPDGLSPPLSRGERPGADGRERRLVERGAARLVHLGLGDRPVLLDGDVEDDGHLPRVLQLGLWIRRVRVVEGRGRRDDGPGCAGATRGTAADASARQGGRRKGGERSTAKRHDSSSRAPGSSKSKDGGAAACSARSKRHAAPCGERHAPSSGHTGARQPLRPCARESPSLCSTTRLPTSSGAS